MRQNPIELILLRGWTADLVVPIMIVDDRNRIIDVNRSAEDLLRVRRSDVVQRPLLELIGELDVRFADGRPLPEDVLVLSDSSAEPSHFALCFRDAHEIERSVHVTLVPVTGQEHQVGGAPLGTLIIFWEDGE